MAMVGPKCDFLLNNLELCLKEIYRSVTAVIRGRSQNPITCIARVSVIYSQIKVPKQLERKLTVFFVHINDICTLNTIIFRPHPLVTLVVAALPVASNLRELMQGLAIIARGRP